MKKERIIEEMARLDGFTNIKQTAHSRGSLSPRVCGEQVGHNFLCPAYLEDDNAVMRIVRGLDDRQGILYDRYLHEVTKPKGVGAPAMWMRKFTTQATTAQMCEALLRMAGEWEED